MELKERQDDPPAISWMMEDHVEAVEPKQKHRGPIVDALLCGLGNWRPTWLQWLANHYAYSVAFILIGIIQGMSYTYFNGIVTTLEKAFHVDSSTMGFVLAGNDISQILCGFILTHVANRGNRPFWMATGILIGALSCFIYASTQLFWDERTTTTTSQLEYSNSSSNVLMVSELCSSARNATVAIECNDSTRGRSNMPAAVWLFFGQFVSGIGGTATYSLGFAYMDDNIKKRNSPLYIGLTSSMRSLGPTLGYLLASFCLNIYINPNDVPEYESRDPRWLGAWWLGFLVIGILQTLFAFPILLFPRELPSRKAMAAADGSDVSSEKFFRKTEGKRQSTWQVIVEFVPTIKRLTSNPIMIGNMVSFCIIIIPVIGVSTFMPKYLEARFGRTASQANVLTGLTGQMMIMVGIFTGGVVIWKFKPRAVYVAGWTCVVDLIYGMGYLAVMNLDCNDITLEGVGFKDGRAQITSDCSKACDCVLTFDPVCIGRQNFLSPCLAGCSAIDVVFNATKNIFYNCSCGPLMNSVARSGFCAEVQGATCPNLWIYLTIIGSVKMVVTSTRVGCIMLVIRCVLKEDKGVALTSIAVAGSIFGFIPGPIIYGAAVDSSCLLWEETPCGEKGNCWFYDVQLFSYWFHGLSICLCLITVVVDIVTTWYCRHLKLYDEEDVEDDASEYEKNAMREAMLATRTNSIKDGL